MTEKITEIEVNGVKYVPKENPNLCAGWLNREMVIVRCQAAGCFFGEVKKSDIEKGIATLKNARRLWYWAGAASLSQLAVDGTSKPRECKFPIAVQEIELFGVIEIIKCSEKSITSIEGVAIWKE